MRIGIITFQRAYSYGAKLQAYALSTYLCSLGHKAEVIDYSNIGEGKAPGIRLSGLREIVKSSISYLNSLGKESKRRKRLQSFFLDETPHSDKRYLDSTALESLNSKYDIFIAGSDQVWCPRYNLGDLNFLLDFVKDPHKKFSYAASFGFADIDEEYRVSYANCLNSFNRILVREAEGAKIVKELTGKQAEVVLDPTFLIDKSHWEHVAKYPFKKRFPYILCFKILSVSPTYQKLIDHLHRITGYKIVTINTSYRYKPIKGILYSTAGPKEFLGLIKNAEIVITNSFHATVFSILFNKDFYTVLNDNGLNSRMTNLSAQLGLSKRMIDKLSLMPNFEDLSIDYTMANTRLSESIQHSKQLLNEILQ